MSQACKKKNSNEDEEIFNFILTEMKAEFTKRTFDTTGKFNLGGILATHLLLKTPDGLCGEGVKMLSTDQITKLNDSPRSTKNKNLLSIEYVDFKKSSPELKGNPLDDNFA